MEEQDQNNIPEKTKFVWSHRYTLVLLFNAAYILFFYYLMKTYA